MEEILASIRKIISEDSAEPAAAPAPVVSSPKAVEETHEADVLELTQELPEEPAPPPPAPVVAAAPPAPAQPEHVADDVEFQPIEEAPVTVAAQPSVASGDGIFSDKTRKAMNDAFTTVEPEPEAPRAPVATGAAVAPVDGRTLEAVFDHAVRATFDPVLQSWLDQHKDAVIDRMKPVVTAWLDEHFPTMLEDAVREELARAARARVRR
jgi:cell pole-organizing protein PopZ